jgi:hypothetical protein
MLFYKERKMNYSVNLEGFEGQNIEVKISAWKGPKLLVRGEPAQKGKKRGEMILQRNDGKQVIATWKPQFMGLDVPQLVIDGRTISLMEPLKWYQWVWSGLPILLLFVGGAIGALIGIISFSINAKVFRMKFNGIMKYVVSGIISILAVVLYFVLATIFVMLVG